MYPCISSMEQLKSNWESLLQPFNIDSRTSHQVFLALISAYCSGERFYHNLAHIQQVLGTIEQMRTQAINFPAIQLAAWFHDVIYNPRANDNEERSAEYAEISLKAVKLPISLIEPVKLLILDTKTHQAHPDDIDSQILLDADLAILGASEPEYLNYAQAIHQEYSWMPDKIYKSGRQHFLQNILQRERIYFTELLCIKLEEKARRNMQAELIDLSC